MKKIIIYIVTVCALLSTYDSFAQKFMNGDNVISLGLGAGGSLGVGTYSSQTPAISAQFEHGAWDVGGPGVISLGGYLGFKSYSYHGAYPGYTYSQKWNYTIIGVRSAYHFNGINVKELDVYGGVMLSYDIVSYKYSSNVYNPYYDNLVGDYGSGIGFSLYVGGRYYFTDNIGGFLELGYGISFATVGISFHL